MNIVWVKRLPDLHAAYSGSTQVGYVYLPDGQQDWCAFASTAGQLGPKGSLENAKTAVEKALTAN